MEKNCICIGVSGGSGDDVQIFLFFIYFFFFALTILRLCLLVLLKVGWRQDRNLGSEKCGIMENGLRMQRREKLSIWAQPSVLYLERSVVTKWQRI